MYRVKQGLVVFSIYNESSVMRRVDISYEPDNYTLKHSYVIVVFKKTTKVHSLFLIHG